MHGLSVGCERQLDQHGILRVNISESLTIPRFNPVQKLQGCWWCTINVKTSARKSAISQTDLFEQRHRNKSSQLTTLASGHFTELHFAHHHDDHFHTMRVKTSCMQEAVCVGI